MFAHFKRWTAGACLVLVGGLLASDTTRLLRHHRAQARRIQEELRDQARKAAQEADALLQRHAAVVEALAGDLEAGRLRPRDLAARMDEALRAGPPSAVRLSAVLAPGLLPGPTEARMLRVGRDAQGTVRTSESARGAFARDLALEPGRTVWDEPVRGEGLERLVVVCRRPFRLPGGHACAGGLELEMALDEIQHEVQEQAPGETGYGFLLSRRGVYLADPLEVRVRDSQRVDEVARESGDPGRLAIARAALAHEAAFAEGSGGLTGKASWIFLEPVTEAQWSLGLVVLKDELVLDPPGLNGERIRLVTLAVALAWCLLWAGLERRGGGAWRHWAVSLGGSAATVAGMAFVWYFSFAHRPALKDKELPVTTRAALDAFQARFRSLGAGLDSVRPDFIPTGIFIQQLESGGHSSLRVCGQVWGRFPAQVPPEARGFLFPEAVSLEQGAPLVLPAKDGVLVMQPFKGVFPMQKDTVKNYPFDQSSVRLRLWPRHFHGNQILVPDLAAYKLTVPSSLPGVDAGLSLPGWNLRESRFTYFVQRYNTNFGVSGYVGQQESPELVYALTLRRKFTNPFIATFLPILVVTGLLFSLLLTVTRVKERASLLGYNPVNVLRSVISLFFPVVLAQINLRTQVVTEGLLFIEYYYFAVYLLILAVAADALAASTLDRPALAWGDNLGARLLFWPAFTGIFFGISMLYLA